MRRERCELFPARRSSHDASGILERCLDRGPGQPSLVVDRRNRDCMGTLAQPAQESCADALLGVDDCLGQIPDPVLASHRCRRIASLGVRHSDSRAGAGSRNGTKHFAFFASCAACRRFFCQHSARGGRGSLATGQSVARDSACGLAVRLSFCCVLVDARVVADPCLCTLLFAYGVVGR